MAIYPEIALGVRPPQIQPLHIQSPLERYSKMLTLRGMMEQQQLRGMQTEQTRLENEAIREKQRRATALGNLFTGGTRPTEAQILSVGGPEAAVTLENLRKSDKAGFDAWESQTKISTRTAQGIKALPPEQRDFAYRAERTRMAAANPALAAQLPEQYPGHDWLDQKISEGLGALQFSQNLREQEKFDIEKPGLQADTAAKQRQQDASVLAPAAARGPEAFTAALGKLPPERQEPFLGATTPLEVAKRALPSKEFVSEERAAATAAELARHREVEESRLAAGAKDLERHRRSMEARVGLSDRLGLAREQRMAVNQVAGQFDNEPMVKNYNVIAEAGNFVKSLGEGGKGTPSDDQALIYAYAKAMDPGSVVREGEYATVQKYSQSWAQQFGFKVERIFSNSPFLSDDARKQMKDTIGKKVGSAKVSYDNIYKEYGRRIERNAGVQKGTDFLTNYGQAFEGAAPAAGAGGAQKINTKAEYDQLPKGARYVDAQDGKTYTKR